MGFILQLAPLVRLFCIQIDGWMDGQTDISTLTALPLSTPLESIKRGSDSSNAYKTSVKITRRRTKTVQRIEGAPSFPLPSYHLLDHSRCRSLYRAVSGGLSQIPNYTSTVAFQLHMLQPLAISPQESPSCLNKHLQDEDSQGF